MADIKPFHIQEWVDSHATWGNTAKRNAIVAMKRAFNWADKQGRISVNPIRHAEKPTPDKREDFITAADHDKVLVHVRDQAFRDLLVLAWETGARPRELFRLEARHVDLENGRWVFPKSESKGKRQSRTIYLSEIALEITQRLMAKPIQGPLLRNANGLPWGTESVNCRFGRLKKWIGKKVCLFLWRHGFAHRMLSQQVDSLVVATLMGHVDTTMLSTVYGHLMKNQKLLREAVQKSVSGVQQSKFKEGSLSPLIGADSLRFQTGSLMCLRICLAGRLLVAIRSCGPRLASSIRGSPATADR